MILPSIAFPSRILQESRKALFLLPFLSKSSFNTDGILPIALYCKNGKFLRKYALFALVFLTAI